MRVGLPWVRLVPLIALLWGLPAEATAEFSRRDSFNRGVEKIEAVEQQQFLIPAKQPLAEQTAAAKQNDTEQDVLFTVEGTLAEGDERLGDESLHDVHVFEGQAEQIVRITLTSDKFDTFLILQDASGDEVARNDDGIDGSNAEIILRLPATEQYRIVANAYDESGKGAYLLTVERSNEAALYQVEQRTEADRLLQQGNDAFQISQYQTALVSWQSALKIYVEIGDRQGEATSRGNMGLAYVSRGEYQQAIDFYQQSLAIAQEIGDRQREAASLGNSGNAYDGLGEYQRAIEFHQQSLAIAQEIGDRQGEANALGNSGNAYDGLGEYQRAIELYRQQLSIVQEIGDRQGEAYALGNLGSVYDSLGEYQRAIDFHQQSLVIVQEIGDRQGEAASLGNLGNVYDSLGNYQRAVAFHQQSLVISQEIGNQQIVMSVLGNLGLAYYSLGEYQQAIDFQQQSLEIARETGNSRGTTNALGNLGLAYYSLGEYQQAIDFQQQSLAIAREIGYRLGEARTLGNLGITYYSQGEYQQAVDFHQQYSELAQDIGYRLGRAVALTNSGLAYLEQGKIKQAETSLIESIYIYENLRAAELADRSRISLFETQSLAYRTLEQVLVLQNKFETALEISERSRTRSFVQLLSEKLSLGPENQELTASPSFSEIQSIAKNQQSTLVEYSLVNNASGDDFSLYIWLVQPTGDLHFKEVAIGDSLIGIAELVTQSRSAMGVRGRGLAPAVPARGTDNATEELTALYQLLIEPIEEWLPDDPEDRVVFIPQDDLFLVPFPALQDESGTHLIEQHTILTAPSIQVLDLTAQQATAANSSAPATELLIVGNPVMPEVWSPEKDVLTQLSSLIGAEEEAQTIANFFETEALLGAQATEQAVKQKMGNARIVHLATHGLLEYGTPEESGVRDVPGAIALTPTDTEDGLLTAAEIIEELTLKAELVVLSACDTGLGTITGDGVIGLSRSLIAAGTPSVIVSLWAIPDAPTAELMTEFYRQRQQGLDKAQALRQAMLETMKNHPNPRDWAAFTLIGEAD